MIRPLLLEKVPLFVLSILSSAVAIINHEGALYSLQQLPAASRIANALVSYVKYLGKMLWPQDLAIFYPHPIVQPLWQVLVGAFFLLAVTFLVIRYTKHFPYLSVGWLWYLGTLVPVIGLFQAGSQAMADRFSYVPLIGIFLMIAWGVPDCFNKWSRRKTVLWMLSGSAILACIVITWVQLQFWRDNITLFQHTLKVTTNNFLIDNGLGAALAAQGNIDDAIVHFQTALSINPGYAPSWYNLGNAYGKSGQTAKAVEAYQQALRTKPEYTEAWNNLGVAYRRSGQTAKAIEAFQRALRINPGYAEAWNNLGAAYGESGRMDKAIEAFQQALRFNPEYTEALNNLGIAYRESGQTAKAIETFQQALHISPDMPESGTTSALPTGRTVRRSRPSKHSNRPCVSTRMMRRHGTTSASPTGNPVRRSRLRRLTNG